MKKIITFLFLILISTRLFSCSVRSGSIAYSHISGFSYQFTIAIYSNDSAVNSILMEWGDGTGDTLINTSVESGSIVFNEFTGAHTFPSMGTYVPSVSINYLMDDIINIQSLITYPFYLQDTLKILDPQFFGYNNSPLVLNSPPIFGYVNSVLSYNPDLYDPDGDSISFSLVPFFAPGYSYPVATTSISIDEVTGEFTWDNPIAGGNYAIAILATEWRSGSVIGTTLLGMVITIEDSLLSVHAILNENSISIFPNPAENVLNIDLPELNNGSSLVAVTSLNGEKILVTTVKPGNNSLDISFLSKGTYLLQMINAGVTTTKKFVKF